MFQRCLQNKDIAENVEISDVLILETSMKMLKNPMSLKQRHPDIH